MEKWNFASDWKPPQVPALNFLGPSEPVFHGILAGGHVYVPGAGGTLFKLAQGNGRVLERINHFGTVDPYTFTTGAPVADSQGNLYYQAVRLAQSDPWTNDIGGAWLIKVLDGIVYVGSRAHRADRYSFLIAVTPNLKPKWVASLRGLLNDGCGTATLPPASGNGPFYITQLAPDLTPEWKFANTTTESCQRNPDGTLSCAADHPDGFMTHRILVHRGGVFVTKLGVSALALITGAALTRDDVVSETWDAYSLFGQGSPRARVTYADPFA